MKHPNLIHMHLERMIRKRMGRKPDGVTPRADLTEFLRRNAGKGPHRTQEEIEDLVSAAMDERR
jgi:hypothetical protein